MSLGNIITDCKHYPHCATPLYVGNCRSDCLKKANIELFGYKEKQCEIKSGKEIEMSENYIVINGKKAELTEDQLKQLGIELPKNKRWKADKGELYYYVTSVFKILVGTEESSNIEEIRYNSHNYFKTREEAQKYARVLETEMLLRKYADEHNDEMPWDGDNKHYYLAISFTDKSMVARYTWYAEMPRIIYFSSEKILWEAVNSVGEENVKEYLTYEW